MTRSELAGGVVEENLRNEFAMSLRFRCSFGLFPSCEVSSFEVRFDLLGSIIFQMMLENLGISFLVFSQRNVDTYSLIF